MPVLVDEGRDMHLAALAVEADHPADPKAEAVPVSLRAVRHFMQADVHAARRDLVQLGLPHMRACLVDQRHRRHAAPAELLAQRRCQLQAAGTAADDDDAMQQHSRWRQPLAEASGCAGISTVGRGVDQRCWNAGLRLARKASMPSC